MKKTTLFMILALVLSMAIGLTGTLAYLTDTDEDVNVMTLGNVDIEQIELERVEQVNQSTELQDFSQNKPLYPAVGEADWSPENQKWPDVSDTANSPLFDATKLTNVQDKFVFVENTGKSDAYVRTIFAFEIGSFDPSIVRDDLIHLNKNDINDSDTNKGHWSWTWLDKAVEIDGSHYAIAEAIYLHKSSVQNTPEEGILPVGFTSYPSLLQVYLDPRATNEDCEALDGNGNGTYDILVVSQAVQAMGFDDAETALDEAFGDVTDKCHPWMKEEDGGQPPYADPPAYPVDVTDAEEVMDALLNGNGGDIIAEEGLDDELIYEADGAIDLDAKDATIVLNGSLYDGVTKKYSYLGFVPAEGESASVSNLNVTGSGFVELGHYPVNKSEIYTAENLNLQNMKAVFANTMGGDKVAAAFAHYGTTTLKDCSMTGTTTEAEGYKAYDAAFPNSSVTFIQGGEYDNIYIANQAHVTITDGAKIGTIDSAAITTRNLGKLTVGSGATVDTINLIPGSYKPALTIEPGATVGQINYNGVSYTQAEWMAR